MEFKYGSKTPCIEAYYNRGCCHFDIKDYEAAIADFSQAIQIDPNQVIAYTARGNAHLALGNTTKAELDFQKAMGITAVFSYLDHSRRGERPPLQTVGFIYQKIAVSKN